MSWVNTVRVCLLLFPIRVNPLFIDVSKNVNMATSVDTDHRDKSLPNTVQGDARSSSSNSQSPSSSGYESSAGIVPRFIFPHRDLVELSPASDYRRHFLLRSKRDDNSGSPCATAANVSRPSTRSRMVGHASVMQQNTQYVTCIQMPAAESDYVGQPSSQWESYNSHSANCSNAVIPSPVWPSPHQASDKPISGAGSTDALIAQNKKYVTRILIAPRAAAVEPVTPSSPVSDQFDSIVTDSLLAWTSYGDGSSKPTRSSTVQSVDREENHSEERLAELSVIRQLSHTMSKSRTLETVSRALSKSSCSNSGYESSEIGVPPPIAKMGPSLTQRLSAMKERWEKQAARRRLLTNDASDEEEPGLVIPDYQKLDYRYIPRNGDINYITVPSRLYAGLPPAFSFAAGINPAQHFTEPTLLELPSSRQYSHLDVDRLSNSSSRSSGSRRVTFSADTVDNENSTKSCSSSGGEPVGELKLNPQYLPSQRYVNGSELNTGRLSSYYTYNLQIHSELQPHTHYRYRPELLKASGEHTRTAQTFHYSNLAQPNLLTYSIYSSAKGSRNAGNKTMWENYHHPTRHNSRGATNAKPSHGNLQLHPNYGAALQINSDEVITYSLR